MPQPLQHRDAEHTRILLGLLELVERDKAQSQRRLASELGIALGLLNAYLKRCIRKGLVKMQRAPARRYAYYLTPRGFAEKSRLTMEYLSYSLEFFRQAKADCLQTLEVARGAGFLRLVLAGRSDLAEITIVCALESGINIVAVVDPAAGESTFTGKPSVTCYDEIRQPFDAVIVTDIVNGRMSYERAVAAVGSDRVLFPKILRITPDEVGSS